MVKKLKRKELVLHSKLLNLSSGVHGKTTEIGKLPEELLDEQEKLLSTMGTPSHHTEELTEFKHNAHQQLEKRIRNEVQDGRPPNQMMMMQMMVWTQHKRHQIISAPLRNRMTPRSQIHGKRHAG